MTLAVSSTSPGTVTSGFVASRLGPGGDREPDNDNVKHRVGDTAVAASGGPWSSKDTEVGDASDLGGNFDYDAYVADRPCRGWPG